MPAVQPSTEASGILKHSIFRTAAVAFWVISSVALVSDYIGPDLHVNYAAAWTLAGLAFAGGVITWLLPWGRMPVSASSGSSWRGRC